MVTHQKMNRDQSLTVPAISRVLRVSSLILRAHTTTFAPNPGKNREFHLPGGPGVRVDTAAYRDYVIPPHYDSLIAKLIVRGKDRAETLARARRALEQFIIEGVKTSIPLHRAILDDPSFIAGNFSTRFMETFER